MEGNLISLVGLKVIVLVEVTSDTGVTTLTNFYHSPANFNLEKLAPSHSARSLQPKVNEF